MNIKLSNENHHLTNKDETTPTESSSRKRNLCKHNLYASWFIEYLTPEEIVIYEKFFKVANQNDPQSYYFKTKQCIILSTLSTLSKLIIEYSQKIAHYTQLRNVMLIEDPLSVITDAINYHLFYFPVNYIKNHFPKLYDQFLNTLLHSNLKFPQVNNSNQDTLKIIQDDLKVYQQKAYQSVVQKSVDK